MPTLRHEGKIRPVLIGSDTIMPLSGALIVGLIAAGNPVVSGAGHRA
jgi:hypothetical protein